MRDARHVVHDLDVGPPIVLGRFLLVGLEVVDARNAVEHVEPQIRLVAQVGAQRHETLGRHLDPGIDGRQVGAGDPLAKLGFQPVEKRLSAHDDSVGISAAAWAGATVGI
jgi:hypothetical protein